MAGTLDTIKCRLLNMNGMPDHVHLLVSMGREVTIAELVGTVKSRIHHALNTLRCVLPQRRLEAA